MRFSKSVLLAVAAMGVLALPALADGWHGGYHGGYRGGWGVGIGFPLVVPAPYYGGYYGPAYYDAPYYYDRAPVVVGHEVAGCEVGGDVVVDAQRELARKGYYRGAIDGSLGPQSRAAIRAWQADIRLPVTGQLDARTLRSLALL